MNLHTTHLVDRYEATGGPIIGINNDEFGGYYVNLAGRRMVTVDVDSPDGIIRDFIAVEDLDIEVAA